VRVCSDACEKILNEPEVRVHLERDSQALLAKRLSHLLHHTEGALEGVLGFTGATGVLQQMAKGNFRFPSLNRVSEQHGKG
jgi:hypothetical protein